MQPKRTKTAALSAISLIVGATGGATVTELSDPGIVTTDQLIQVQEERKISGEQYEQLLKGGVKPGDATDKRKREGIADNIRVDVYDGPKGAGYVIVEQVGDKEVHVGFGPEAEERTMIITKPGGTASTTDNLRTRI